MHSDILQAKKAHAQPAGTRNPSGVTAATVGSVWHLEISRPSRRNAVDSDTARSLSFLLEEADRTASCRAVVLSGQGGWFCAGSDLKELAGKSAQHMAAIEAAKAELSRTLQEIDLPVVCAVEGLALGGGVSLAASCDFVVSSRLARWQMPEVANGWLPPWGIDPVIARCGSTRARQVLWGAEPMDGVTAHAVGLVDFLTDAGEATARAFEIANRVAQLPPIAAKSVKRYVRGQGLDLAARDRVAADYFITHCQTEHAKATLAKFGSPQ